MNYDELISDLKKANEKNIAEINFLKGYIRGLEVRITHLESQKNY